MTVRFFNPKTRTLYCVDEAQEQKFIKEGLIKVIDEDTSVPPKIPLVRQRAIEETKPYFDNNSKMVVRLRPEEIVDRNRADYILIEETKDESEPTFRR